MERWAPNSTQNRHCRNYDSSRSMQAPQPDCQPTMPGTSQATTTTHSGHLISQYRQESLQHAVYPSVNASGNANLILGNVHEVHYHVPPPMVHEREQLLSSLHFREMFMRYENIDEAHSDTFGWIFQPPEDEYLEYCSFLDWINSNENVFWVSGKPGSGKSVLMKYLTQTLQQSLSYAKDSTVIMSFWFWEAAQQELERSLLGCLRSLLWQALQVQPHSQFIVEAIGHNVPFQWTKRRLLDALNAALGVLRRSNLQIFLFLDGLDESGTDARELLGVIRDLSKAFPAMKICVSSRPEPIFKQFLADYQQLQMQELNMPDVRTIIRRDLFEAPEFTQLSGQSLELAWLGYELEYEAQGVLLWVRLIIKELLVCAANGDTLGELKAHLNRLPAELEGESGLFSFMLKRNATYSKNYLAEAAFYLRLAVRRESTVLEYFLATNDDVRNRYLQFHDGWETLHEQIDCSRLANAISARTGGLLEVTRSSSPDYPSQQRLRWGDSLTEFLDVENRRRVDFLHRTARSFLLETKTGQGLLETVNPTATLGIDRVLFEVGMVTSCQLQCLQSVTPSSFHVIRMKEPPVDSQGVAEFKELLDQLRKRGYFWTEPYRIRWLAIRLHNTTIDLPLPTLDTNRTSISFAHVFAFLGWTALAAEEVKQVGSIENPVYYHSSILNTILADRAGTVYFESGPTIETSEFILSLLPSPDIELIDMFGERISMLESVRSAYDALRNISEISCIERWIGHPSHNTRTLQYEPSMLNCSSSIELFTSFQSDVHIFAAMCPEEAATLRELGFVPRKHWQEWNDILNSRLTRYPHTNNVRILCVWEFRFADIPNMYAVATKDYIRVLSHLWSEADQIRRCTAGIIGAIGGGFFDSRLMMRTETTDVKLTKVRSLIEAFRLLGKSESSIEAFLAVEEPRIRLMWTPERYQAWRAWLYGTDESSSTA